MGHFEKRNTEIIKARKEGATHTAIAAAFSLSRSRIQQITSRAERAGEKRLKSERIKEVIRESNDLDRKWPTDFLLESLSAPWLPNRALKKYCNDNNLPELSLKDLMDFIMPKPDTPGTNRWITPPALKQKGIGFKTYKLLVAHLSKQDLGNLFNSEWEKRTNKLP
jgi:hypothetical protein